MGSWYVKVGQKFTTMTLRLINFAVICGKVFAHMPPREFSDLAYQRSGYTDDAKTKGAYSMFVAQQLPHLPPV